MANETFRISVKPLDVDTSCGPDVDLLAALREAGIGLESVCGGIGTCGKCVVHILEGEVSTPTVEEMERLSHRRLERGVRLACQTRPLSDLVIYLPASSLTQDQKLQLTAKLEIGDFDPSVEAVDLEMSVPTSAGEPGSDLLRVMDALKIDGEARASRVDLPALRGLAGALRADKGRVRAFIRDGELLEVGSRERPALGLAVDLGSTKVALFLYHLLEGRMLASRGFLNPQVTYGEDIITRIQYAIQGGENARLLMEQVVHNIDTNLADLLAEGGYSSGDIFEMVLVGNTAMHHLFLNLPVEQLGRSPYVPATDLPLEIKARDLGLEFNPSAVVYLPPPIAGFVGSDHLAAVAAVRLRDREGPSLLLDIGTNTEVALKSGRRISCCSCASGPAFEGGDILWGMRAAEGAIEQVSIHPQTAEPELGVIGAVEPIGICGSGILAAVNALREAGLVDAGGRFDDQHPQVVKIEGENLYYLAPPPENGADGISITQRDVREIQKAKGAIRTGIDVLLKEADIRPEDLEEVLMAGAFGTYIDPAAAVSIALLPPVPLDRIRQVGNAAGAGARGMLLSRRLRSQAESLASSLEYIELATYPDLGKLFAANMFLSEEEVENHKRRFSLQL